MVDPRPPLLVRDLGRDVPYGAGVAAMRGEMRRIRTAGPTLLLLEHSPTITVTRSAGRQSVRSTDAMLAAAGIEICETDRGGDVTFHGPGQLVGYPVVQLERRERQFDLGGYLRALEQGLVTACTALGVEGCHRREGLTGVWVTSRPELPASSWHLDAGAKKLVAIGVGVGTGGVTRHGFALNIDIDLERYTAHIVPCGIKTLGVTSLSRELRRSLLPDDDTVRAIVSNHVADALGFVPLSVPMPTPGLSTENFRRAAGAPRGAIYG